MDWAGMGTERGGEEATLRLVQEHAGELLRFARRFSLCADDAHDAYQRSLEILVRRMRTDPPEEPLSWLRTVIRHESIAVRAQRERLLNREEVDFDLHEGDAADDLAERVAGFERLGRVAEALQRLKPQEVTALVLRAEGLSYREICERTGWTYTKVNRAITEGRRALLDRLDAIESGAECERWLPQLSALADGEATWRDRRELRPHLRACPACRAVLRAYREAPRDVAALVPVALVPLAVAPGAVTHGVEAMVHGLLERATLATMRAQGTLDALTGAKLAAVAASTAAIAGGGVAIERTAQSPERAVAAPVVAVHAPASAPASSPPAPRTTGPARPATAPQRHPHRAAAEFDVDGASTAAPRSSSPAAAPAATVASVSPTPKPSPPSGNGPPSEFAGP